MALNGIHEGEKLFPNSPSRGPTNFIESEGNTVGGANDAKNMYVPMKGNTASQEQILDIRNPSDEEGPTVIEMKQEGTLGAIDITKPEFKNVFNGQARISINGETESFPGTDNNPSPTAYGLFGTDVLSGGRADQETGETVEPV